MKTRSHRQRELEFKVHAGGFQFGQIMLWYQEAVKRLNFPEGHSPQMMVEIILLDEEKRGLIEADK